jgi:hypothetical protein
MGRRSFKSTFNPYDFASCWWRPGDLTGSDGATVTELPIRKGTATVTAQSGQEPTLATSANGKRLLALSSETMVVNLIAGENNQTKRWGIAFWMRPNEIVGTNNFFIINAQSGGASAVRIQFGTTGDDLFANIFDGTGSNARRGINSTFPVIADEWQFLALLFDGNGESEAERLRILLNCSELPLTFAANPTTSEVPTALQPVTGNGWLFASSGGGSPASGHVGPDIWMFGQTEDGFGQWPELKDLAQFMDYDIPTGLAP